MDYSYDALGDLLSKTNVGTYSYGTGVAHSPLHAVINTNGPTNYTFSYDLNGNMTSGAGRTFTWTSFNKVASVQNANNTLSYSYDANFDRYKEVESVCTDYQGNTGANCVKYLINPRPDIGIHFEKEIIGSLANYRHFLYAGPGNVIGVYTTRSDGSRSMRYFHKDHLGSIVASTDESGKVAERLSYDSFGKRRNLIGRDDPNGLLKAIVSHQGFGGQEHLDDGGVGLIDMNGRVYDPFIGRFTSPDPNVPGFRNLQSLNRYSYVLNNPTRFTDPSGYWPHISLGGVVGAVLGGVVGSTVGAVAGGIFGSNNGFVQNHAETIAITAGIVGVSAVTFGAADVAMAGVLGTGAYAGFGAAVVAGAVGGATAGALSSTLLGGGFSWQSVGMGAVTGVALTSAVYGVAGIIGAGSSALEGYSMAEGLMEPGTTAFLAAEVLAAPAAIGSYKPDLFGERSTDFFRSYSKGYLIAGAAGNTARAAYNAYYYLSGDAPPQWAGEIWRDDMQKAGFDRGITWSVDYNATLGAYWLGMATFDAAFLARDLFK